MFPFRKFLKPREDIMNKTAVIFSTGLIILAIILYFLFNNGIIWFVYPSSSKYPIKGLDVSHHQGKIDWSKVKDTQYRFVYIKATEGDDYKDRYFKRNWDEAKKAGLKVGGYHFFHFRFPGKIQAENFIESVPNDPTALPPVVDLEIWGNSKKRPAVDEFRRELIDYINVINNHYKRKPVLYLNNGFYNHYLNGYDTGCQIWIRDILCEPSWKKFKWLFWQYHCRASVPGISGPVDLNVYYGDSLGDM